MKVGRAEDWEAVRDIFKLAGQASWNHILAPAVLADLSAPERWNPSAGADMLVADAAGTVTAFVRLRASGDEDAKPTTGEIDGFYVLPLDVGRGVGRALLAAGRSGWWHQVSEKSHPGPSTETIGRCGLRGGRMEARWPRAASHVRRQRVVGAASPLTSSTSSQGLNVIPTPST